MRIWHRLGFSPLEEVDGALDKLGITYKKLPSPSGRHYVFFEISESDPRWPAAQELRRTHQSTDLVWTEYTEQETLEAEWARLVPRFEQGYPQPKTRWLSDKPNYIQTCLRCGAGFKQVAPFRLAKEPHMGKKQFMTLYWTYALFAANEVFDVLEASGITGYSRMAALLHRTGEPATVVSQLLPTTVAEPALVNGEELRPQRCPECGIIKYEPHKRGYMRLRRESLSKDVDVFETYEWFGSGGMAFREILVSHRFVALAIEHKWQGATFRPVVAV